MATALREILAEFQIKVDLSELVAADTAIDRFISKLREVETLIKGMPPLRVPGAGGSSKGGQKKPGEVAIPTQGFDSAEAIKAREAAVAGLTGKTAELTARLFDQKMIQDRLAKTIQEYKTLLDASGNTSESAKRKLNGLEQQFYRVSNQVQKTTKNLHNLTPAIQEATEATGFFGKMRAMFGHESSSMAQGQLIPGGAIKNLKDAAEQGDGLFAVLGRLRRIWGLLQFSVSGGFALAGIKGLINEMDEASKQATRLNLTIEDYQVVSKFAELAGASTDDLSNTLKALAKNVVNASEGAKAQAKALKDLGVETKNTDGTFRDTTELLFEVGGALGELEDGTKRLAIAQKLLGKGALSILPAFKDGKKAALEQLEALRALAVAYDQDTADAAEAFNDTLDISTHQLRSVALQGVSILLPYLVSLVNWTSKNAQAFKDLMRSTSALQSAIVSLGAMIISYFGVKMLKAIFNIREFGALLVRAAGFAMRFVLPFLILEDIITWLRGGKSLLGEFLDKFKPGTKDSKAWLESVRAGFEYVLQTLKLLGSAWRVFRAKFWNDGSLIKPGDLANEEELRRRLAVIGEAIKKALGEIWEASKPAIVSGLKSLWNSVFGKSGEGLPDSTVLGEVGVDIAKLILAGMAAKLVGSLAIDLAVGFAQGFVGEIARILFLGGRIAIAALSTGMSNAAVALLTRAFLLGSGIVSAIGSGILAAMAAISAPVMALAVVAGAILLLFFSEKAREIAFEIGEKLADGIIWIVKAVKSWGPKIWDAAKAIAVGFRDFFIAAIDAIIEWIPKIKDALIDAITNFSWAGFVDGAMNALKFLGDAIGKVFSKVGDFLRNPFKFLDGIGDEINKILDTAESISWGTAGRGMSNVLERDLSDIRSTGAMIAPQGWRPTTVVDKRTVTQSFQGSDPEQARKATLKAIGWVESPSQYQDSDEIGN